MTNFFDFEDIESTPNKVISIEKKKKDKQLPSLQIIICELEEELEELTKKESKAFNKKLENTLKIIKPNQNKKTTFLKDFIKTAINNELINKINIKRMKKYIEEESEESEEEINEIKEEIKEESETKIINKELLKQINEKKSPIEFLKTLNKNQLKNIPNSILLKCINLTEEENEINFYIKIFESIEFSKGIWEANFIKNIFLESIQPNEQIFYLISLINNDVTSYNDVDDAIYEKAINYYLNNFTISLKYEEINDKLLDSLLISETLIDDIIKNIDYKIIKKETIFGIKELKKYNFNKKLVLLNKLANISLKKNKEIIALLIFSNIKKVLNLFNNESIFEINYETLSLKINIICCKFFNFIDKNIYFYKKMGVLETNLFSTNLFKEIKKLSDSYKKFDNNILIEKSSKKEMEVFRALFLRIEGDENSSNNILKEINPHE